MATTPRGDLLAGLSAKAPGCKRPVDIIYQEVVLREQAGEKPALDEYIARFPAYEHQLRRQFALHEMFEEESSVVKAPAAAQHRAGPTRAGPACGSRAHGRGIPAPA